MKKLLVALLAVALTSGAKALSFSWTADAVTFNGTVIADGTATAYLVYLGSGSGELSATATDSGTFDISGTQMQTSASSTAKRNPGRINATFEETYGATLSGTSDTYESGSTFGVYLTYVSEGVTWYNFSASTYTIPENVADNTTGLTQAFAFDYSTKSDVAAGNSASGGSGWVQAVPEPSTAALALAGLALLLKRRKA